MITRHTLALCALTLGLAACGGSDSTDPDPPRTQALLTVKRGIDADLATLASAVAAMQSAAPAPDADGWNATADAAAVTAMRTQWKRAREAYEHIEGAIAVLFPELDVSTDARYDAFLTDLPMHRDDNLFDGDGVTGMHAVERILWADVVPARVVTFEMALPGYRPAAFPANAQEATAFRDGLVARLLRDVRQMQTEFGPLALDPPAAFRGVQGSMREQIEKLDKAASAEEESRYAQSTLFDMRANLVGAQRTWAAFRPWVLSRNGAALAARVDARFTATQQRYDALMGDALPQVPAGWNPDMPSAEHLATPYGQLHTALTEEVDPRHTGSLVYEMDQAAALLDIPRLP